MNINKRVFLAALAILLLLPLMATTANATPVLDFTLVTPDIIGAVTLPSPGHVAGSQISIGNLTVTGAPGAGSYLVTNGFLNFSTAANTISIVGDVLVGSNFISGTLLSGTFTTWNFGFTGPATAQFTATGSDAKNPALVAALGIPAWVTWEYFGFTVSVDPTRGVFGVMDVTAAGITNTAVPEPSSILLLSFGLLGVAGYRARRSGRQ
jgi:hypothetical protein